MECVDYISFLGREKAEQKMREALLSFKTNSEDLYKRGIYVYGAPGTGKTRFVKYVLAKLGYDIVHYDAGDIRNKSVIETITKHNMANRNVISMFQETPKPIAVIMDEIDGMNNGDKGGINSLIKLIRPKKTKKQKTEDSNSNPIICISNYHVDKKIKELIKVCTPIELKTPTKVQMKNLINKTITGITSDTVDLMTEYLQGDLRKLSSIQSIHKRIPDLLKSDSFHTIFNQKSYNEDTKDITKRLINKHADLAEHTTSLNETDRTIVGLLWHENIVDVLSKKPHNQTFPFYLKALDNICYADYVDRITFQKQIWQFNEMSSLIKTFKNNKLYHETFPDAQKYNPTEVRFTKTLTKYSTEYNNATFIQTLCQQLVMDKKDMFAFFIELREKNTDEEIYQLLETHEITKLDVNRIYRYLDKYTKCTSVVEDCDANCEL